MPMRYARLTRPLVRDGGELRPAGWDEALDRAAAGFQRAIDEGSMTGLEVLMFVLDHTTHHRASAEMYLRAKGITPTDYQF